MNGGPSTLRRRTYLRTVTGIATAGMVGFAGCQELDETDDATETGTPENGSETSTANHSEDDSEDETGDGSEDDSGDETGDESDDGGTDEPEDGSNTTETTGSPIDVVHAVGHVSPAETVTTIELTVKRRAGADAVDLSALALEFADDTVEATLAHGGEGQRGDATGETFVTTHIAGEGSHDELVTTADRVTITFDASLVRGDDGLPPGSSALVALVDPTGARYAYGASIPSTFGGKDVVTI